MKYVYAFILGLLCSAAQSQVIAFADTDFKAALLSDPFLDANSDGEISQQEAAAAGEIFVNGPTVDNLDGLQYFTNLSNIYIMNTSVASIALPPHAYNEIVISGNPLLTSLDTGIVGGINYFTADNNDALPTLSISGLTSVLISFSISGNAVLQAVSFPVLQTLGSGMAFTISNNPLLGTIDFQALQHSEMDFNITHNPNLLSLDLSNKSFTSATIENNGLTSIDLGGTSFQYNLSVADNQLGSLDLSTLEAGDFSFLDLSGNNYTAIEFIGPWSQSQAEFTNAYTSLMIDHSHLAAIDFDQPVHLGNLTISNNLQLGTISFRNGDFETCAGGYCSIGNISASNNPALQLVCTDAFEGYAFNPEFYVSGPDWVHQNIDPDVQVSTNCFYEPPGVYNAASGIIRFDADADGCSAADTPLQFIALNGIGYQDSAFSNSQGAFTAYTTGPSIILTPNINTAYFTVTPASQTYSFAGNDNSQTADFCVTPNGSHNDLHLYFTNTGSVRPGFEANYMVSVKNEGTVAQSCGVDIAYGPEMSFVSATLVPASTSGEMLHWDLPSIAPLQAMTFNFRMLANTPTDSPALDSGDIVSLQGSAIGLTDETPSDNTAAVSQTVVNAMDPNEKIVAQGAVVPVGSTNADGLTYTVHFQNLGTGTASRVIVNDVLDTGFAANSTQVLASSHEGEFRSIGGRLEFWFENIDLVPASQDEAASQGFVTFNVKSATASDLNFTYSNTADIYFDYNAPIATNTTETTTVLLGTPDASSAKFSLYPNPANDKISIASNDGISVKAQVYSLFGKLLIETREASELTLDVSKLCAGTYLVTLVSGKRKETRKLVKL